MNAAAHNSDFALAGDVPASAGVRGSALVARWREEAKKRREAAQRHPGPNYEHLVKQGRIWDLCANELEAIL